MTKLLGIVLVLFGSLWMVYFVDYKDRSHFKWYTIVRDFSVGFILIAIGLLVLFDKIEF